MTRLVLPLLLALAVLAPSPSFAQPKKPNPKALIDAGMAAQKAGDHDKAIESFDQAYAIAPQPILLFRIAESHRAAGRDDKAAEFYQKFLASNPTGPETQQAQEAVAAIETRKADEAKKAEEARLAEEAKKAEEARLTEEAKKAEELKQAEAAAKQAEDARKAEEANKLADKAARAQERKRTIGLGAMIGGGVVTVGSLAFGIHAAGLDSGQQRDRETAILIIGGVTGAIATINGFRAYREASEKPPGGVALAPWAAPHGGGLVLSGSL